MSFTEERKLDEDEAGSHAAGLGGILRAGPRAALGWLSQHRRQALVVVAASTLLTALSFTAVWYTRREPEHGPEQWTVADALAALEREDLAQAQTIAQHLQAVRRYTIDDAAAPPYVLGVVAYREASGRFGLDRSRLFALAAEWFQLAARRGFLPDRQAEILRLWGASLYESGQMEEAADVLGQAVAANAEHPLELLPLLVDALCCTAEPDFDAALRASDAWLRLPGLAGDARDEALLRRGEIFLRLGNVSACREALGQVAESSPLHPRAQLLAARAIIAEAQQLSASHEALPAEAVVRYEEAVELLRKAESRDTLRNRTGRQVAYLLGICWQRLGDQQAALAQFQAMQRQYIDTTEAQAALLSIADLLLALDRHEEAAQAYCQVLAGVAQPELYNNPWISLKQVQDAVLLAHEQFMRHEHFAQAVALAEELDVVVEPSRAQELLAGAWQRWGSVLLEQAESAPWPQSEQLAHDGRDKMRSAAAQWRYLAQLRFTTRSYPDDLWAAAQADMAGHNFSSAQAVLEEYLLLESRPRRTDAQVLLGQSLLNQEKTEQAIATLRLLLELQPQNPAVHRARLLLAQALAADEQHDAATEQLLHNLQGELLTPESPEWRASLLLLGKMLYRQQQFDEAARRLDEALARWPDDKQFTNTLHLAAESHRRAAQQMDALVSDEMTPPERADRLQQALDHRLAALAHYEQVRARLESRNALPPHHELLLRSAYFSRASLLLKLDRLDAALLACQEAVHAAGNDTAVLHAYMQLAACYRRLGEEDEARGTLRQAQVALAALPPEVFAEQTADYSLAQWQELLQSLVAL